MFVYVPACVSGAEMLGNDYAVHVCGWDPSSMALALRKLPLNHLLSACNVSVCFR